MQAPRSAEAFHDVDVDWKAVGLRRTPQRSVVLALVRSSYDHPTAEWIHREARQVIADISLATVYRTLRLLKEKGLVYEFSGGASPSRYDGMLHGHEHVRCLCCGAVRDVDLPEIGDMRREIADRTGFAIGRSPLLFQGICAECARRGGNRCWSGPATADAPASANGTAKGRVGDLG
jgi:Fe2+ or Zn2+ uptake regulation protein